ncbi:PilZ domain-containing protein [Clostridium sp.]|uniref:PilZ domain-containing protein n=1 Tax=Clostridium sp. TaxID=1506 RepID=UPI00260D3D97|nr:PilZ domain-containing protein [Clostridium sp.]
MKGYSFLNGKEQVFQKDRRVNHRHEYNHKFKIESVNLNKVDLEVKGIEISISGIGFISDTEFKKNDMLEIAFKYNNVTIPAIVKVRHVNLYDFGFVVGGQFVALQDAYRKILQDLK